MSSRSPKSRDQRRITRTAAIGALATLVLVLAQQLGALGPAERFLYDARARYCQFFAPPPSQSIVHLDIDDPSLEAIGEWPWPRARLAELLEEVGRANPRAMCLDITFPGQSAFGAADDQQLAETIDRIGNVLVPINFTFQPAELRSRLHQQVVAVLTDDIAIDEHQLADRLKARGIEPPESGEELLNALLIARRDVLYRKVHRLLSSRDLSDEQLLRELVPGYTPGDSSALTRGVERQAREARAILALERFTRPPPPVEQGPTVLRAYDHLAPIAPLGKAAAMSGFVDYLPDPDGIVRSVPLLVEYEGRVYTQMALAVTCLALGVELADLRIEQRRIVIPRDPRTGRPPIVIPTRSTRSVRQGVYDAVMDVPWFGPPDSGWVNMYDRGGSDARAQHVPMANIWDVLEMRRAIRANNLAADQAILVLYEIFFPARLDEYRSQPPVPDDFPARREAVRQIAADSFVAENIEALAQAQRDGEELDEDSRLILDRYRTLAEFVESNRKLTEDLQKLQSKLRLELSDKVLLVGFTASSVVQADIKRTSLHAEAPGVVVHGTIVNGLLTGELWSAAPPWFAAFAAAGIGLAVAVAVAVLPPMFAALFTGLLFIGYLGMDALVLFDYGNIVSPLAAPLIAAVTVWAACTVHRYIEERRSRARITARFRTYVDPVLVDYVIDHPDQTALAGETRELTVGFTDLAGFTTLSERLKGQTVPLLNEYMGLMVPVIRARRGYVNKFLGDGIMFFYGAPLPNDQHARDAVATVLEMQGVCETFSRGLMERGLPGVIMRAGVLTGEVVVGDAGSITAANPADRASDYTVLGDNVNLASRLEGANKATGTLVLISGRTAELLNGEFLLRPVAKLQVVGKSEGVITYEPLAYAAQATDAQRQLAELTKWMFELYTAGRWQECLAAADVLDRTCGRSKLTDLYRRACLACQEEPPAKFNGAIVLTEK